MKTHVMIKNVSLPRAELTPLIKEGDEVTLTDSFIKYNKIFYCFEEHKGCGYNAALFAPIKNKPENILSSGELEEFLKERVQEGCDTIKQPEPQTA